jgi:hypothetical protein
LKQCFAKLKGEFKNLIAFARTRTISPVEIEPAVHLLGKCAILFALVGGEPEVSKTDADKVGLGKDDSEGKGSLWRLLSLNDIRCISEGTARCSEKLLTLKAEIGDVLYLEMLLSAVEVVARRFADRGSVGSEERNWIHRVMSKVLMLEVLGNPGHIRQIVDIKMLLTPLL